MMANIIFIGAPGSGKGTQSSLLANQLQIPNISTGEMLRQEVFVKSKIGDLVKSFMDSGELVPDDLIVNIIKKRIAESDCNRGFILDGFPRNFQQAERLESMLRDVEKQIDIVINIEVNNKILIKRISGRFSCKKCGELYNHFFNRPKSEGVCDKCKNQEFDNRSDDNEETVKNRLKVYNQKTKELIEFYSARDLIYKVDGLKDIDLINLDISKAIDRIIISNNQ